jgi:hypothetical protein
LLSGCSRSKILVMGRRVAYGLLGVTIGLLISLALNAIRGPHHWESVTSGTVGLCLSCAAIVVGIAERKGKIKPVDHGPLTLFPRAPDPRS